MILYEITESCFRACNEKRSGWDLNKSFASKAQMTSVSCGRGFKSHIIYFINLVNYGIELRSISVIVGQIQQQCQRCTPRFVDLNVQKNKRFTTFCRETLP